MSDCLIVSTAELASIDIAETDYIVFGGTFDPFHEGHLSAIKSVIPFFKNIIIAPTEQNPWKEEVPIPLQLRLEMARLVLNAEGLIVGEKIGKSGVYIAEEIYSYSEELVKKLRSLLPGRLFWLIGEDSRDSIQYWRNWQSLHVPVVVAPVIINVHAEYVRSGKFTLHPAIEGFAKKHQLYGYR